MIRRKSATQQAVLEIRQMYNDEKMLLKQIAKRTGISPRTIHDIIHGNGAYAEQDKGGICAADCTSDATAASLTGGARESSFPTPLSHRTLNAEKE